MLSEFILPCDPKWKRFLSLTFHDFYHLPEYVSLSAKYEQSQPIAFYGETDEAAFLVPLLTRKIPENLKAPDNWYDATTPYGYPTPLLIPPDDTSNLEMFLKSFREMGAASGMISAFFRLHPLLPQNLDVLAKFGTVVKHGQTVYIDLSSSVEEMWSQTTKNHRKDINKLTRLGFQALIDDWSFFDKFIALYRATMQRVSASEFYFFDESYFVELRSILGDRLHLCTILSPEGEVASSLLFISINGIVQTYLSGTFQKYLYLAPSKLEIDVIRRWAKENGNRLLHLGGGVGSRDDSLFKFKSGFSDLRSNFYTYRMIINPEKYTKLIQAWEEKYGYSNDFDNDFFPLYRSQNHQLIKK
ncbi:GNAT family N-acetyltransferase [Phormidium sp. LEGE 05292]|uniref:GNAT family N-acetyltransferase n=1 Tax=[Phormidium] sp. LEGE 05292 TaxID=767427 RepID=UPI00187E6937|nr:GNAT family N-acetyltransferase [Phormidium sp. LEGE 05292]MBE9223907.1 GNAT family N-acetyltransferase [Phormidium sp. LEGE 05292]